MPFTYCSAGQFVIVVTHGEVPWNTVEVVGKFVTAKLVLLMVTVSNAASVDVPNSTVPPIGK